MAFNVETIRADFPILTQLLPGGRRLAYLDNGATSQKPWSVIRRVQDFLARENANIHRGLHYLSAMATTHYEEARATIADALRLPPGSSLIFTRGATESINLVTHGLAGELQAGDEVVLTLMEHHANFVPWQMLAENRGVKLRFASVRDNGELDLEDWKAAFSSRTKAAAFTHVSNALGTINPVAEMVAFCRDRGVLSLVDGAQSVPHGPVDLTALDADFFVFSGHKVFGPDGIGVLTGRNAVLNRFRPYQSGGDMIDRVSVEGTTFREAPERFEAGTPHISGALGLAEAFRYLSQIDWSAARAHEKALLEETTERLKSLGGIRIWGEAPQKSAIISFTMDEAHPQDIAAILDEAGVAVRTGHHCTQPLMRHLGITGTVRASFAIYNNREDIDALCDGLRKVKRIFSL